MLTVDSLVATMSKLSLNPWFDSGEWDHVKRLVLARDIKALDFLQVILETIPCVDLSSYIVVGDIVGDM